MSGLCQECGAPATDSMSVVSLVPAGETSAQVRVEFCRGCEATVRVRLGIPRRPERKKKEPIATWNVVSAHQSSLDALFAAHHSLTSYERSMLAELLWEQARHLPRPIPADVVAWFSRTGVDCAAATGQDR